MTTDAQTTQTALAAIDAAVRDYADGWYTGDADRMRRALHPEFTKRRIVPETQEIAVVDADTMVEYTAIRHMPRYLEEHGLTYDASATVVDIDQVTGSVASVRCASMHYFDFVHLVDGPDGWQLINAAWRHNDTADAVRQQEWSKAQLGR